MATESSTPGATAHSPSNGGDRPRACTAPAPYQKHATEGAASLGCRSIVGLVRPGSQYSPDSSRHLQLALKALDESRWSDAAGHIRAVTGDETASGWRLFLEGDLYFRQGDLGRADPLLLRAAATAVRVLSHGKSHEGPAVSPLNPPSAGVEVAPNGIDVRESMRLAGAALELLGVTRRRLERFDEAARAHLLALALRREHGSIEEQWQSALSLGLVARLAGDGAKSAEWSARAMELAARADGSQEKQAIAAEHLARALGCAGRRREAVATWRQALDLRLQYDPSTVEVPRAQARWAEAMVHWAEAVITEEPSAELTPEVDAAAVSSDPNKPRCADLLARAVETLQGAHDALAAFGHPARHETEKCARLLDFARRLQASLDDA